MPSRSQSRVSRRSLLKQGAAAAGGALGGAAFARPAAAQGGGPAPSTSGLRFRAFVRFGSSASVETLRLIPIGPRQVVIRNEAAQICYTTTRQALGTNNVAQATVPGHGGVGRVIEVGSAVRRVEVGDRVILAGGPQCGECYHCLHGFAARCLMVNGGGPPNAPFAEMLDGTPVSGFRASTSEIMVAWEESCVPVFTDVSSPELAMLHDVGMVGLAATMTLAPVEPGSDVAVLGCGPLGLSAVQGARIKGAAKIVAVEPIRYRRELALKLGATHALDPNAEGDGLVARVREICRSPTTRLFAGGGQVGPDFVIEAVGGDMFPPKVEAGPDPTGVTALRQAWDLCSASGHLVTTSIAHGPDAVMTLPATQWANGSKNHHPGNLAGAQSKRDLPRYVKLIEAGRFDAKSMLTTFPLERAREAYEAAAYRTVAAAVLVLA